MADERRRLTLVLDTGPVVALDRLGYAESLARGLIGTAVIPSTVAHELHRGEPRPGAGLAKTLKVIHTPETALDRFVREHQVQPSIHAGELGVVALTVALRGQDRGLDARAVIDDLPARKLAIKAGLTPAVALTGTLGLLIVIHDSGLAVGPLAEEIALLQRAGYRFSDALVRRALEVRPDRSETRTPGRLALGVDSPIPRPRRDPVSIRRDRSMT